MRERWRTGLRAGWYLVITLLSGMVSLVMLPLTLVVLLTVPIGGLGLWCSPLAEGAARLVSGATATVGPVARKTVQEVPGPGTDGFRRLWKNAPTGGSCCGYRPSVRSVCCSGWWASPCP